MFLQKTSGLIDTLNRTVSSSVSKTLICSFIFSLLVISVPSVHSQEQIEENDKERIRVILLLLTRQAALAQEELDRLSDVPETPNILEKRNELQLKLDGFNNNFESLATQLNTDDLLIRTVIFESLIQTQYEMMETSDCMPTVANFKQICNPYGIDLI